MGAVLNHRRSRRFTTMTLGMLALLARAPAAGQQFHADRASFLEGTASTTTIDFNDAVPGEYPDNQSGGGFLTQDAKGVTLGAVRMVGTSVAQPWTFLVADPSRPYCLNGTPNLASGRQVSRFWLPAGTRAFGVDWGFDHGHTWGYNYTATVKVTVYLANGGQASIDIEGTSAQGRFFGVIAPSEITTVLWVANAPCEWAWPCMVYDDMVLGGTGGGTAPPSGANDAYSTEVMRDNPYVYYRLDETEGDTARDLTSGGRHGVYVGGVTKGSPGALTCGNPAAGFDGSTAHVRLPGAYFREAWVDATFEVWCRAERSVGNLAPEADGIQGLLEAHHTMFVHLQSDYLLRSMGCFVGPGHYAGAVLFDGIPSDVGRWHHVVLVVASGASTLYVDGHARGTNILTFGFVRPCSEGDVYIANGFHAARWFQGTMDEVAIYDHALSAERVRAHFLAAGYVVEDTRATLLADPTTVVADNVSASTLTLTYKNADGSPIVGHSIRFFTNRVAADTLSSDSAVTDADGKASITVKSITPGVSTFTCHDVSDGERKLACSAQVTFTSAGGGPRFTYAAMVGEGGCFVKGIEFPNKITVRVQDWGGSPGVVRFDLNGQVSEQAAPSGEASVTYDMGKDLLYPLGPCSRAWSTLKIAAMNAEGQESAPQELHWMGLDLPPLLTFWMPGTVPFGLALGQETVYSLALTWPPEGVNLSKKQTRDDRCMAGGIWGAALGQFEAAVEVSIKPAHYPSTDVEGEVKVSFGPDFERKWNRGGRKPKNNLTIPPVVAEASIQPYLLMHFLPDWYCELGLESTIKTTYETPDFLNYIAPTSPAAAAAAFLLDVFGRIVFPSVSGRLAFSDETGEWQFSQGSLTMGAIGSLVVSIDRSVKDWLQVEAEAGLKAGFGLQFPGSDENSSKYGNRNFAAYGASFFVRGKLVSKIPFLEQSHEWPAVNFAWTEPANWDGLEALSNRPRRPAPRPDREYGPPSRPYLSSREPYHRVVAAAARHPFQPWLDEGEHPGHARKLDSGTWDVAELKLVENVNNVASPSLAYLDGKAVIVYVYDRPSLPAHQATEIRMLRETGTGWADVDVTNDTALDSQPSVAVSPDGKLVVVWTRMANVLETDDPATRYSKAEIAWSVWDPVSETWSPITTITADALLDLNPGLTVGRDGLMYLTWLKSPDNVFPTDFSTRQLPHTDLWVARWDGSSFVGVEPAIARTDTSEHIAFAVASSGERLAVWSQDRDGDAASDDLALYFSRYAGGAWTAPARVDAADAQPQSTPAVTFTTSDVATLFYVRSGLPNAVHADHTEENLVVSTLVGGVWSAPLFVARSGSMAHLDVIATPDGKASAIWTASSTETADLWSTVFDPTTATFNHPVPLTKDQADERQLSAAWDPAGNPSAAYLKRRLEEQERQVEDDQGNPHTVTVLTGVANDLYLLTHAPKPDLAVTDADLTVDPPAAGPGETAALSVTVRNLRALAASGVQVRFVDRTPDGDTPITTVTTDPAIIVGGGSAVASTKWTLPSDGKAHMIVAVVDPEGAIVETDETNNEASYALLRPDLAACEPYAKEYLPDGSLKIGLPIRNAAPVRFGAPVEWKLWLGNAGTGTLLGLGTASAPDPGQTQDVEVVWTPGGSTPSDPELTLVVDPDGKLADDDRSNNTASGVIALRPDLILNPYDGSFAWNPDGTGAVEVTLQNNGWCAAENIVVAVLSGPPDAPGTVSLGSTTVAGLARYANTRLSISIGSNGGLTAVYVIANPDGAIGEVRRDNNTVILTVPSRTATSLWTIDRVGTITELAILRQYDLKRTADNALLEGCQISYMVDGSLVGTAITNAGGDSNLNWIITDGPATRQITVRFDGDGEHAPSAANGTLTAETHATKMTGVDREGKITAYRILKAWLWRMDNSAVRNKTIAFKLDGTLLGTDVTRTTGLAQIGYTIEDGAGAGVREIRAEWAGDGGYLASSCTNTLTVYKATPYIWVMPRSVPQGGVVRMYAYFRRLADYQKQEGKTVTFRIDGTWIADVVTGAGADAGIARYQYTSVEAPGAHTMRCEFAGDAWVEAGYGEGNLTIY